MISKTISAAAIAVLISAAPPLFAQNRPFPQAGEFESVGSVIGPNHISQEQMNSDVVRLYRDLRTRFFRTSNNGRHSWFEAGGTGVNGSRARTNSETHGYGMMILVLMAGANGDEKEAFDRMNALRRVQGSNIAPRNLPRNNLMSWVIHDVESSTPVAENRTCWDEWEGCWQTFGRSSSATDGDMDMAFALLLAYAQWDDPQYLTDALAIINSIKDLNFHPGLYRTNLGDWHGRFEAITLAQRTTSRSSDWMPGHFRAFYRATNDSFWETAANEVYALLSQVSNHETGLMADFVIGERNNARTVANSAEALVAGEHNWNNYAFNACRVPWRLALDYVHYATSEARDQISRISTWLRGATGGNPAQIGSGYLLNGTRYSDYSAMAFAAPFASGMLADAANQQFLNATYNNIVARGPSSFYNESLRLMNMLLITGNWWGLDTRGNDQQDLPFIDLTRQQSEWQDSSSRTSSVSFTHVANNVDFTFTVGRTADPYYAYANIFTEFEAGDFTQGRWITVTYTATGPLRLILDDPALTSRGAGFYVTLPTSTEPRTTTINPRAFSQPSWVFQWSTHLIAPNDLSKVSGIRIESLDQGTISGTITQLQLVGFTGSGAELPAFSIPNTRTVNRSTAAVSVVRNNINLNIPTQNNVILRITDVKGRQLLSENITLNSAGIANFAIPATISRNQILILSINGKNGLNISRRFLLQ